LWLDDIQQFYRERSVIEKEYSAKLAALAKKYYEKKAKKSSSLSVGDTPLMTPGSLERYGLAMDHHAWSVGTRTWLTRWQRITYNMDNSTHYSGIPGCGARSVWRGVRVTYRRTY